MADNTADLAGQLEQLVTQLGDAVKQYKTAAAGSDDFVTRLNVITTAQKIAETAKKPEELWHDQSVFLADVGATRLFQSWQAFDIIPPVGQGSITYKDLAAKLDAEESLVRRIAWVLVSVGTLKQIGSDAVENTQSSMIYANKHPSGVMFQIMYDEANAVYCKYPEYFKTYGRKEPKSQLHTPWAFANGQPESEVWNIMAQNPQRMKDFMQCMNTMESHLPILGFYDFSWVTEKAEADPGRVLFVDVGGGQGQAIRNICKHTPQIPLSRCVLQDRPDVIQNAKALDQEDLRGATLMPHDFHTEQPVKGALIYWVRRVIHDYSDDGCANILKQLADAAAPDSRILIVEQVMDNPPVPLVAQTDFCMIGIAGKERTREMFAELAARAGLKVMAAHMATGTPVGAVECVKA